jgi:hypothetical protein
MRELGIWIILLKGSSSTGITVTSKRSLLSFDRLVVTLLDPFFERGGWAS